LPQVFLAKPEAALRVKLEVQRGGDVEMFQCSICGVISLARDEIERHVIARHVDDYFDKEETEGEPPKGQFVCVARCGLSGELLGPPNHHSYSEKLQELHRTRFSHMAQEAYESRVEMVHDPEVVEQWKQASCRQTVYRTKGSAEEAEPVSWSDVESHMRREVVPSVVTATPKAILSYPVAKSITDDSLRAVLDVAWRREQRTPRSLAFALRQALRHKYIYSFKARNGDEFVSIVPPQVLDAEHAAEPVKRILDYVSEHAGCTAPVIVAAVGPESGENGLDADTCRTTLSWLTEKGHLVEYFDGTLEIPSHSVERREKKPRRRKGDKE
jgi:hypothetical protein